MVGNLEGKTASGIIWVGIERTIVIFVQFVIGIILARILDPSAFGLIGMITIFMAISDTIVDSGFANALIHKKDVSSIDYSTALIFNATIGIGLYVLLYLLSPYISIFYQAPLLTEVIRVYAVIIIVNSLIVSQLAKLSIELRFRTQSLITIYSNIISGIIAIVLAYIGCGVWALVFQSLCGAVLRLITISIVAKIDFRFQFSKESFMGLWNFGSKLLCSGMINTVYNNAYTLFIGKAYNASQVGFYNRADQFSRLPSNTLTSVILRVIFPILSKLQDDNASLRSVYERFIKLEMFILAPIMISIVVLAKPIVLITVGEQWLESVPLLRALCCCYLFDALTHLNLNLLYVKGRTDLVLRLEFIKKPIGFILLLISIPFGVLAMCISQSIYSIIAFCINCMYTNIILDVGLIKQIRYVIPIFLRAFIMGGIIILAIHYFDEASLQLLVGVLSGILSYFYLSIKMGDDSIKYIMEYVRNNK